jgi:predicted AlkP superfamily phosphohydrolase/phosphomutase
VALFYNIVGVRVHLEGDAKETLCQEIMHGLHEIVDPETGQGIVREVFRASDYFAGPNVDNVPDIIAILKPDYGCSLHLSHYSSDVTRRVEISGPAKHRTEGIFVATGTGIVSEARPLPHLRIEDIAPTVLHLMGLPIPTDMDGRVLAEVIEPALVAIQPIRRCPPLGFWPEEGQAVFSEAVMTEEDEEVIRDRLRALGYFE